MSGYRGSAAFAPASWVYGAVVSARNKRFDRGVGVTQLPVPVVSVGNITLGGTGKSPTVRWIAQLLQREGVKPVIAMRGYKAQPGTKGDEQLEHEDLLPGVDVLANPDRLSVVQPYLAQHDDVGCVILDDGFQHRKIARDLDIVLIDAQQPCLEARVFPAGPLREPIGNLERADAVIVTRAERVDSDLVKRIEQHHGKPPMAWLNHAWTQLRVFDSAHRDGETKRVDWLRGREVAIAAGIGNPEAFVKQVESAGATVGKLLPCQDHQAYPAAMFNGVRTNFGALVTTHKDWVKIRRVIDLSDWQMPIVVPELAIQCIDGEAALLDALRKAVKN